MSPSAAGAVYDALTGTLRLVSWLLLALGVVVASTALLTAAYGRRGERPRRPRKPRRTSRHKSEPDGTSPGPTASGPPRRPDPPRACLESPLEEVTPVPT
ncbi:hypothetical protein ACFQ51_22350 [Streptomyces kaempferi]